jgi:acyl carrier protein
MYQDAPIRRDLHPAPAGVDGPPERSAVPHLDGHDEVMGVLRQIVSDVLRVPVASVTADSALTDLPSVESIKLLRIAGKVERRFDIELDNEALFRRGTLGDLAREIVLVRERAA